MEVTTVLSQKAGKDTANDFLVMVMNSKDAEVMFMQDQMFIEVVEFFKKRPEKKLSFVDFSLLHLSTSHHVITFDKNLEKAIQNIDKKR